MNSIFEEKIAISYFCAGESYRESAVKQLENKYFDDDNVYYFIITDDKDYFKHVQRKNLIVNDLKDFYQEFPQIEKYEALIESTDKNDYAEKFIKDNYAFSFSLMRFNLLQAYKYGIKNVALMCTDTILRLNLITPSILNFKNTIHNAVSEWNANIDECPSQIVKNVLQQHFNLTPETNIRVLDAAGRFFIFDSLETMKEFFDLWNKLIVYLYENNLMVNFKGSYVYNDEYILAPLYNIFGLNKQYQHCSGLFEVNHNQVEERFWSLSEYISHTNYDEFLKINNLQKNG